MIKRSFWKDNISPAGNNQDNSTIFTYSIISVVQEIIKNALKCKYIVKEQWQ